MSYQRVLFLSTCLMLMSWQGVFAADPNFLGTPEVSAKPKVPTTEHPQGPLMSRMVPDTMGHVLAHLPFKEGWKFLTTNKTYFNDVDVWRSFAGLHGISVTDAADTAEEVRAQIIEQSKNALRTQVQSTDPVTPELIESLLHSAQEKPFLWDTLIEEFLKKNSDSSSNKLWRFIDHIAHGTGFFASVSGDIRRLYIEGIAAHVKKANPESAEYAQESLNRAARRGELGFTPDRGTPTSGYDYLVEISKRRNSDGTPGLGAENAQIMFNNAASTGQFGFTPDRGTPTSGYDYLVEVAARRNPDGTPGLGAVDAQGKLNYAALRGELGFTPDRGTPTSGYDYLVEISKRRNPDGSPELVAKYAQKFLDFFEGE